MANLLAIFLILGGLLLGANADEGGAGAILGGVLGFVIAWVRATRARLAKVEQRAMVLEAQLEALTMGAATRAPGSTPQVAPEIAPEVPPAKPIEASTTPLPISRPELDAPPEQRRPTTAPPPAHPTLPPSPVSLAIDQAVAALRAYFLGGNTVVRAGVLLLIVGVGLLGKWAADNDYFPPAARLILASFIGLALVGVGWRLRIRRAGFAHTLQGGGTGVLYVTVFLALRVYELLPAPLAFVLLVGLAVFSHLLAVLQNSAPLAVLGGVGGFLAPIMASTGEGNHVFLFGYYTLLNLGILAVAWFKTWRSLNVLGWLFTFGVASAWGVLRYEPELYASTQPFLIIFFLIYVAIPVLFAWRSTPRLTGPIDGTLVFGTPLVVFGMQAKLVADLDFGLAYSAFGFGAVYLGVATILWRVAPEALRGLVQAFLPIGVGFATVAIPFAFDNEHITGAVWALEGAGLLWVGVRQQRWLPRLTGLGLQVAAMIAFAMQGEGHADDTPFLNALFVGVAMIALGAWACSVVLGRHGERVSQLERGTGYLLALWGTGWWAIGGAVQLDHALERAVEPAAFIAFWVLTIVALELAGRALGWIAGRRIALLYPWLVPFAAASIVDHSGHPLADYGWAAVGIGIIAYTLVLWRQESLPRRAWVSSGHLGQLWLVVGLVAGELAWGASQLTDAKSWAVSAVLFTLAVSALVVWRGLHAERWPLGPRRAAYTLGGLPVILGFGALWAFGTAVSVPGDSKPLPYVPLINPMDLTELMLLAALAAWSQRLKVEHPGWWQEAGRAVAGWVLALGVFGLLNAALGRAVHHYTGVGFDNGDLFDAVEMQTGLSILWTLFGLAVMITSTRMGYRPAWFGAVGLLLVVVVKLLFVDLSSLSQVARVISFLVVGVLFVLAGYFSPLPPPKRPKKQEGMSSPPAPVDPQPATVEE